MNDQNETAQLRFLEETAIRLRQNGFTVEPIEDHHLPVCWEKGRLCRISGKGSVLYRQENVSTVSGAQDALQSGDRHRQNDFGIHGDSGNRAAAQSQRSAPVTTASSRTSVMRCWRATPPSAASSL